MDFTAILIGLGIIIILFVVGKIFAVLTKIFFVILLVLALALGFFFWQNSNIDSKKVPTSYIMLKTV